MELIQFITLFYENNKSILLIDEPCAHLSSQYKIKFRNKYLNCKNNICKQIILITHDIELISYENYNNIIRLDIDIQQNITSCYYLKNINGFENSKKLLIDNKQILFSNKILLVEGYSDYRVVSEMLNYWHLDDYHLIILGGCGNGNGLCIILKKLNIDYKVLYDTDVIMNEKNKNNIDINKLIKVLENDTSKYSQDIINKIQKNTKIHINEIVNCNNIYEFILNFNNNNNNIYIWNTNIKDIEGIGKLLFKKNSFTHDTWKTKTNFDIFFKIKDYMENIKNKENNPLLNFYNFLLKK